MNGADIPPPDPDVVRQRQVVDAFYAAARSGDFDALVRVLDPDVLLRTDFGPGRPPLVVRGAPAVARLAREPRSARLHPARVNGAVGAVITRNGRPFSVIAFTVTGDKIVAINGIRDPDRVRRLASAVLSET